MPCTVLSSLCLLNYYIFTIICYYSKFINEEIEIQRAYIKNIEPGFEPRLLSLWSKLLNYSVILFPTHILRKCALQWRVHCRPEEGTVPATEEQISVWLASWLWWMELMQVSVWNTLRPFSPWASTWKAKVPTWKVEVLMPCLGQEGHLARRTNRQFDGWHHGQCPHGSFYFLFRLTSQ